MSRGDIISILAVICAGGSGCARPLLIARVADEENVPLAFRLSIEGEMLGGLPMTIERDASDGAISVDLPLGFAGEATIDVGKARYSHWQLDINALEWANVRWRIAGRQESGRKVTIESQGITKVLTADAWARWEYDASPAGSESQ